MWKISFHPVASDAFNKSLGKHYIFFARKRTRSVSPAATNGARRLCLSAAKARMRVYEIIY